MKLLNPLVIVAAGAAEQYRSQGELLLEAVGKYFIWRQDFQAGRCRV
jgi:hypothetical protein